MGLRNRPEVFAVIAADGRSTSKRNVVSTDRADNGKYVIRFPADRFIRPETHKITLTAINNEQRSLQLAEGTGGVQLEVHAYSGPEKKDTMFFFSAERL